MIERIYTVRDRDGDVAENGDGVYQFGDRDEAEEHAEYCSNEHGYGPYAVTVRVPGPGGYTEDRAVTVFDSGVRTFRTDVYEAEMAPS